MTKNKRMLKVAALGGLIASSFGVQSTAQAEAYALAYDNVFGGYVIISPIAGTFGVSTNTSASNATINGSGTSSSDVGTGPRDANISYGTGSAIVSANNSFVPVGASTVLTYSYGDAQIIREQQAGDTVGNPAQGTHAAQIAESNVSGGSATAGSQNKSATSLNVVVQVTVPSVVTFIFSADPFLESFIDALSVNPPSSASAGVAASANLTAVGSALPTFIWAPDGAPGGILGGTEVSDPFSLNTTVNSNVPGAPASIYDPTGCSLLGGPVTTCGATWSAFTNTLAAGAYNLNIDFNVTTSVTRAVPEPGTIALLGAALAMAGGMARRQRAK